MHKGWGTHKQFISIGILCTRLHKAAQTDTMMAYAGRHDHDVDRAK